MTTLETVPKENKPEPSAEELAAKEQGLSLTGPGRAVDADHQECAREGVEQEIAEHLAGAKQGVCR